MAIELGVAYISVLPSMDKLGPAIRAELDGVGDDATKAGSRAGSNFAAGLARTLKTGALAAGAGIALLGGLGLKTAAEMETANIAFTTMLGSAQKAKSFIADLSDFAAKTPFEFPGLQEAASSLISAGVKTRDVIPIMRTLGDVTAGMGTGADGIQRATVAIQQMNAAGRITGEDLNQLRDAGIPVYDLLAAATGKAKSEVTALASAGKLGKAELDAMMKALTTGKGLDRFSGLMEKQAQSLNGQWSTFKDTLQMGLAKAIKPLIPLVKDGLGAASKALAPTLDRVAGALRSGATAARAFADGWKANTGAGGQARTVITSIATAVGNVVTFMVRWKDVLIPLGAGILAIVAAVKIWTTVTAAYTAVQTALNIVLMANPIGLIVLAIVGLVAAIVVAYKRSETFRDIVNGAFEKIKSVASSVFGWLKGFISGAFSFIKNAFLRFTPLGLIISHFDKIKAAAVAVKDGIVSGFTKAVNWLKGLPGRITGAIGDAKDILLGAGEKIIDGLKRGIEKGWEKVKGVLKGITDKIPDWKGPPKKDKVLLFKAGTLIMQGLRDGLVDGSDGIEKYLNELTSYLKEHGEKRAKRIVDGYRKQFRNLGAELDGLRDRLAKAQGELDTWQKNYDDKLASVRDSFTSGDLFGSKATFKSIAAGLKSAGDQASEYADTIAALKGLKLNEVTLDNLTAKGAGGLSAAKALLAAGADGIEEINALQKNLNEQAQRAGFTAAEALYGAGLRSAQGVVDGLKAAEAPLLAQFTALGLAVADAVTASINASGGGLTTKPSQASGKGKGKGKGKKPKVPGRATASAAADAPRGGAQIVVNGDTNPAVTAARVARIQSLRRV